MLATRSPFVTLGSAPRAAGPGASTGRSGAGPGSANRGRPPTGAGRLGNPGDRARFSGHGAFVLGGAGAAPAAAQAELEFKLPNQAELGNSESLGLDDAGT